jgi:hypothetical protein
LRLAARDRFDLLSGQPGIDRSLTIQSIHVRDVARTLNRPALVRAAALAREIDERRTGDRRSSVVPPAVEPVDNRVGAGSCHVTEGVRRCPTSGILPERPRIQCGYRGTYQNTVGNRATQRSVREVANPPGAATGRACGRVEVPTADAERCPCCPKGDRGTASRSRKPVE